VLRVISEPRRKEVSGDWRKLYSKKLYNLYSSQNIIILIRSRRIRLEGNVARMGEMRNSYKLLVGKTEGKRPLRRSIGLDGG
jgi:hypothetical protein